MNNQRKNFVSIIFWIAHYWSIDFHKLRNRNAHSRISWWHRPFMRFPVWPRRCPVAQEDEEKIPHLREETKGGERTRASVCKGGRTLERTRYAFVTWKYFVSGSCVGGCESAARAVCRRPHRPPGRAHRPFYYPFR